MLRGIYLIRHAQSMSNAGQPWIKNSPLSLKGINQAKVLNYEVDTVICSPMRRALDTVFYSKLKYRKFVKDNLARELICEPGDCFEWEHCELEDPHNFNDRMRVFAHKIYILSQQSPSIIIMTHGCVITALSNKQIKNCELQPITVDRLNNIIHGTPLRSDYHEMTGW